MPYNTEHAARLRDPNEFAWIKEIWAKESDGIRALGGQLKSDSQGPTVEQTLRFRADKWTTETAKKWCAEHKKDCIQFDEATADAEPEAKAAPGDYERRAFPMTEVRAVKEADGQMVIEGYSAVFNRESVDMGEFIEELHPECFVPALREQPDVVCLRNHDPNLLLGRTPNTLTLSVDKRGLRMRCVLPNTELGRDTFAAIERGDLKGQSFGFSGARSEWTKDYKRRTITHIGRLHDVGPVTFPAYPDTTVAKRQRDFSMSQTKPPKGEAPMPDPKTLNPTDLRAEAKEYLTKAEQAKQTAEAAGRELTAEEQRNVAGYLARQTDLLNQAEIAEKLEAAQVRQAARSGATVTPALNPDPVCYEVRPATVLNLRSFSPRVFGSEQRASDAAYRSGMWFMATIFGNEAAAGWCKRNGMKFDAAPAEMRAQVSNINTKGGYLVPSEIETAIINVKDQYGVARKMCRIHRMTRDTMSVPIRTSGLTAYPVGETSETTESEKAWSQAELVARKWMTLVKYSSEISDDAIINMADDLIEEIGIADSYAEDNCWLNGTGLSTYHGIRGIWYLIENSVYTGCLLAAATGHDTLAEVDAADLANLYGKVPAKYKRQGAAWLCHPFTKAAVFDRLLQGAGGNQNQQLADGQPSRYAGYPIMESDAFYAPTTAATQANAKVPILFGNFRLGCSLGDRRQTSIFVSDHRYMESDQIAIRGTSRWDIVNHNANCSTSVGPVVGLKLTT